MTCDPTHPRIHEVEYTEHPFREGDRVVTKDGRLGFVEHCWSRMVDTATLPDDCRPWIIHTVTAFMDDGQHIQDQIAGHASKFDPAPASAPFPPWRVVLGDPYGQPTTRDTIQTNYKWLAKKWHPDRGGSTAAMAMLNVARDQAMAELERTR